MKYFSLLFPVFLILLFPTVFSQDIFTFVLHCEHEEICDKLEREFANVGIIIASNLVLNTKILVDVTYEPLDPDDFAETETNLMKFVSPGDQVERLYPTALLKQLNTGIDFGDAADIIMSINSVINFWFPSDGGDIQPDQYDVLATSLHEMMHGLGITTTWRFPPDIDTYLTPRLNGVEIGKIKEPVTFEGFYESVFDKNLIYINVDDPDDERRITEIAQDLNGFTPKGTEFPTVDALFDAFTASDQENNAELMLEYATTELSLHFILPDEQEPVLLHTTEEFAAGTSISHFDQGAYEDTPDFLMIPSLRQGVSLKTLIQDTGDNPGGGIGPELRLVLKTLGYTVNENPPMGSTSTPQKRRFTRRNNQRKPLIHF
ncbi:uncharacterized protein OCT59_000501 [Rhizophagus irregularis]|uniref:Uncharacterized protein n=2 Tax=Rhizophagus irregularis TaxID=588596 RepID=U9SQH8_RHIID|nr:hypothetical protein GLOIN_2v1479922 [Rhizophagus irregularis DAOM 181602=DAOM 197198]EXX66724.1 hypothetical protein RirG_121030 [Rhizophagus irregularis DAOM 197198w]POG69551.1 hypothetical protein GLOIN_2v1479922 [Rhizophagus irregularis DAOM 181602=DAOM 197198]UZN99221.1 hypothetical protein OCT59_000501 [Rhizophagus irregularis]GBC48015.1 hypothetical protein GLOIN_2v1479922 [Rhizophagus irregularis DAOM 181602=DAOM 197198]|eukprot:XP_025176417.1 hypothetical protein GLOIN_2v1479922 [Rhizophagus irregularis DAOM 181602=DAOM 197198]